MNLKTRRFGEIEIQEEHLINFPAGLIGFPLIRSFVLLSNQSPGEIGWLQSVDEPSFSIPVVSAHALVHNYPDVPLSLVSELAGLGPDTDSLAMVVVLTALPDCPATVNLLAPLLINTDTRMGAQAMLDGSRFTTREPFALRPHAQGPQPQGPQLQAGASP